MSEWTATLNEEDNPNTLGNGRNNQNYEVDEEWTNWKTKILEHQVLAWSRRLAYVSFQMI